MSKRNDLKSKANCEFDASCCDQKYIINSSIIIRYKKDGDIKYFRECKKHYPLKKYLFLAIDDYFDNICKYENKEQLKKDVLLDLAVKSNYKKLINLGGIFNAHLIDILAGVYSDYDATGLKCFNNYENEQFILFIQYVNCVLINQRINGHVKNGGYENSSANKQLATFELARLLNIERLIPEVKPCTISGCDRVGTLMNNAIGVPPSEILPEQRKNMDKSTFLKDITTLEYFDALCYQLDHRLDNYNVIENQQGQIARVVAFDNDANRTFFISNRLPKRTYAGATQVAFSKAVNRPYMDKEFAISLESINKHALKESVGEYNSKWQLNALWKRIKLLKKAVKNTVKLNADFLVDDWNKIDVESLADSKYGNTYFNLYLNDTLMLDRKKQFEQMKKQ